MKTNKPTKAEKMRKKGEWELKLAENDRVNLHLNRDHVFPVNTYILYNPSNMPFLYVSGQTMENVFNFEIKSKMVFIFFGKNTLFASQTDWKYNFWAARLDHRNEMLLYKVNR